MPTAVFEKLEEVFPAVVDLLPEMFNSHEFMLVLTREYQNLYVHALIEYSHSEQPSIMAVERIVKMLKERSDLVTYVRSDALENIFEQKHDFEVWQKVRK